MDPRDKSEPNRPMIWIILSIIILIVIAVVMLVLLPAKLYPAASFGNISTSNLCTDNQSSIRPIDPNITDTTDASDFYSDRNGGCVDSTAAELQVQVASAAAAAQNGVRQALGVMVAAIIATAAAAAGVRINNKTVRQAKRHHDEIQTQTRLKANDDRFSADVKQLGDSAAPVRVGALHSLHQLALSEPERLSTVLEVLCAYLRQPFHHPELDREPGSTKPLPFGRTAWSPPSETARDARDAEREVRRTCSELLPDLLPSADSVREKRQVPPLLRLPRAVIDDLVIVNKGFSLDITNTYFGGRLSFTGCYIEGDLTGIDASFSSLTMQQCTVGREVFFEDITANSIFFSELTTTSLILNGSNSSQGLSVTGCSLDLLDISACTARTFWLDEKTMIGLKRLMVDDIKIKEDSSFHSLPDGVRKVASPDEADYFTLRVDPH